MKFSYSFVDPPPAVFNYSLSPNSLDQNKENLTPDPPTINVPLETDELRSPGKKGFIVLDRRNLREGAPFRSYCP